MLRQHPGHEVGGAAGGCGGLDAHRLGGAPFGRITLRAGDTRQEQGGQNGRAAVQHGLFLGFWSYAALLTQGMAGEKALYAAEKIIP
jgi:hypothetical protein